MCSVNLDPEKIIKRFQAGEWNNHLLYWPAYEKYIWQKQSAVFQLAEELKVFQSWNMPYNHPSNPPLKTRAKTFEHKHLQALLKGDTAYARRLLRATQLLKTGKQKWRIILEGLIVLAIIDLRENHQGWQRINKLKLRGLIIDWQRANGQLSALNNSQWYHALKRPGIVELLAVPV
jgi:hypothetical protein